MSPTEEPASTPQPNPATAAHEPRQAPPVMDVTPPPASSDPAEAPAIAEAPIAPAPPEPAPIADAHAKTDAVAAEIKKDQATKPIAQVAKKPAADNSVGLAILATVIIVLGLAVLAIFAYKSSQ